MNTILLFSILLPLTSFTAEKSRLIVGSEALTKKQLINTCIPLDLGASKLDCTQCRVTDVQAVDVIGGKTISMVHYEYFWAQKTGLKNCGYGSLLVTSNDDERYTPVWGSFHSGETEEGAKIYTINNTKYIHIPVRHRGTGALQADTLLTYQNGKWNEVDTMSYKKDIQSHIPKNLYINKGLYPDFQTMTLTTPLWKKDDPNCCGTGGKLSAKLSIEGQRLEARDIQIAK